MTINSKLKTKLIKEQLETKLIEFNNNLTEKHSRWWAIISRSSTYPHDFPAAEHIILRRKVMIDDIIVVRKL